MKTCPVCGDEYEGKACDWCKPGYKKKMTKRLTFPDLRRTIHKESKPEQHHPEAD